VIELSNSEAKTLCKRVFCALNYPSGFAIEIADAMVWSAAAELIHLSDFTQSLSEWVYIPELAKTKQSYNPVTADYTIVKYNSDPVALIELIDHLASSAIHRSKAVAIVQFSHAQYAAVLLPLLVAGSRIGLSYELNSGSFRVIAEVGALFISIEMKNLRRFLLQNRFQMTCYSPLDQSVSQQGSHRNDLQCQLSAEEVRSIGSRRIQIDQESYQALKRNAAASFVPASDLSRMSGAGAPTDDSD